MFYFLLSRKFFSCREYALTHTYPIGFFFGLALGMFSRLPPWYISVYKQQNRLVLRSSMDVTGLRINGGGDEGGGQKYLGVLHFAELDATS